MAEACGKVCYKSELLSAFYDRSLWHSLLQIRAVKCFWIFIPMLENSCKHLIEVRLIFFFFFPLQIIVYEKKKQILKQEKQLPPEHISFLPCHLALMDETNAIQLTLCNITEQKQMSSSTVCVVTYRTEILSTSHSQCMYVCLLDIRRFYPQLSFARLFSLSVRYIIYVFKIIHIM